MNGENMKIGIVTVYSSLNYGAYMQAYALQSILKEKNHDVYFLNNGARNTNKLFVKRIIKKLLNVHLHGYGFQLQMKKKLDIARWEFKECSFEEMRQMDCSIFGSDEIWNAKRKSIYRFPSFFGVGVECKKKIAYAPSVNQAKESDFLAHQELIQGMKEFSGIALRDGYSVQLIQAVLGREGIVQVVDPTLLQSVDFYHEIAVEPTEREPYILLYSYGKFLTKEMRQQIVAFSKEMNLKLVSVLEHFPWCDENPALSPFEVLGYFKNAAYVITDTFHGSIFSMIYNKQFVVMSRNSNKIADLLESFGVSDRIMQASETIANQMKEAIDYQSVNDLIDEKRNYSRQILFQMLQNGE